MEKIPKQEYTTEFKERAVKHVRPMFLGLAFKQIEEAELSRQKIRGSEKFELLLKEIPFKYEQPVQDNPPVQQKLFA